MKFKKFGRVACAAAVAGLAVAIPFIAGCNTDHPEAKITIAYDGTEYVLEYKMYRNMYPQTVKHFIELADNNFYDNMIVHDYQTSYWYTGGYQYLEDSYADAYNNGKEDLLDYMEAASKEKAYAELAAPDAGKITPSVYRDLIDGKYSSPLNTLIGEFTNNQHKIEKGELKNSFGALRMFYSAKSGESVDGQRVYMDKNGSPMGVQGEYKYNSATSLFSIQVGTSTSSSSSYCVFAMLKNTDVLTDLRKAISSNGMSTKEVTMYIDNYDEYLGASNNQATYRFAEKALVIKSVDITKY